MPDVLYREQRSSIDKSLVHWLFEFAAFGVLITNKDLKIAYINKWFEKHVGRDAPDILNRSVIEAFPELQTRAFDRYYQDALSGQTRIFAHRFHEYLFAMEPTIAGAGFKQMQQSARISPLLFEGTVIGTMSVIEDISDRVLRENELNHQIEERSRLLEKEISARELAEENERLRGTFDALKIEGAQLLELGRERNMLMHRIIAGQEEERKRIARNIHDHLGQQLTALRFALSFAKQQSLENGQESEDISRAQAIAEKLDKEVDYLSWELRPAAIDDIGLEEALRTLISEWTGHYGTEVKFHAIGMNGARLGADAEINLYRIVQEALTNISKHAGADSVVISLEKRDERVVLIVEDNGVGFDVESKQQMNAVDRGMGIFGMYERAALVGGKLEIESKPSVGTSIFFHVPVDANSSATGSSTR